MMNVAPPALTEAQIPFAVNEGGGGSAHVVVSTVAVRLMSLGLDRLKVRDEALTLMTALPPAVNWNVPVAMITLLSSVIL